MASADSLENAGGEVAVFAQCGRELIMGGRQKGACPCINTFPALAAANHEAGINAPAGRSSATKFFRPAGTMEETTVTLVIGLAGIIATLLASGLGLYFTATARRAPLREALFLKQLDLIVRLIQTQGKMQVLFTIIDGKSAEYKDRARVDIRKCVKQYSELAEEGAALLPTNLWVEFKRLGDQTAGGLVGYDESGKLEDGFFQRWKVQAVKAALLARTMIGVDQFSEENLGLFSAKPDYERIANTEADYFEQLGRHRPRNEG